MLRTLVWEASEDDDSALAPAADTEGPPLAPDGVSWPLNGSGRAPPPFCRELDDPQQISDLLELPDHYLWLDLTAPTEGELRLIAEEFSLHPLAVEDAAEHSQRPKIDQYDGFYLMVVFAITAINGDGAPGQDAGQGEGEGGEPWGPGHLAGARVRLHEIDLFIGQRFLISVHQTPLPLFEALAERWRQNRRVLDEGIGVLVYTMLDAIVDAYFPILDGIVDRIEDLEEALFSGSGAGQGGDPGDVRDLFLVKKDLLQMRRVVAPERDSLLVLTRQEQHLFDRHTALYFQDVYDHVVRLTDTIDVYQDLLTNALDSYLAIVSNNLNQVMKTLTALTVILMAPTLIAGIYGMNFDQMPELRWGYGYPLALGLMATVALGLFVYFRRKGWI